MSFNEEKLYVSNGETICSLDKNTGEENWCAKKERIKLSSDKLLFHSGKLYEVTGYQLLIYDEENGKELAYKNLKYGGENILSYQFYGDMLIIEMINGIEAYNTDGNLTWNFDSSRHSGLENEIIYASTINGSYTFKETDKNHLVSIDRRTGEELWKFELNYTGMAASRNSIMKPLLENGIVYANDNRFVYALSADSGKIEWKKEIGTPLGHPPVIDGKNVLALDKNGTLHSFQTG